MKRKLIAFTTLIPSAVMSLSASVSCGGEQKTNSFVSMLNPFKLDLQPCSEITFAEPYTATNYYRDQVIDEPEVLKQDILFTYSQILSNPEYSENINKLVVFDQYDMKVESKYHKNVLIIDDTDGTTITVHVKGHGINIPIDYLETSWLREFDLTFTFSFWRYGQLNYDDMLLGDGFLFIEDGELRYNRIDVGDYSDCCLSVIPISPIAYTADLYSYNAPAIMKLTVSGSYDNLRSGVIEHVNDFNEEINLDSSNPYIPTSLTPEELCALYPSFNVFRQLVLNLPALAFSLEWPTEYVGFFMFVSPYMRNTKTLSEEINMGGNYVY